MSKSWKNAGLANKQLLWSSKITYTLIKPSRCPFEKKLALSISYQMMKPPPQTLVHFEVISGVELFCWPVSGPDAGCNTSGDIVSNEEQCNSSSLLHSLDCRCTWEFLAILVTEQHLKHCMWSFNSFLHSVKQVGRRMGSTAKWTVFSRITSTFPTCFFSTSKDWISYCGYICLYSFGRSPTIMLYHQFFTPIIKTTAILQNKTWIILALASLLTKLTKKQMGESIPCTVLCTVNQQRVISLVGLSAVLQQ